MLVGWLLVTSFRLNTPPCTIACLVSLLRTDYYFYLSPLSLSSFASKSLVHGWIPNFASNQNNVETESSVCEIV